MKSRSLRSGPSQPLAPLLRPAGAARTRTGPASARAVTSSPTVEAVDAGHPGADPLPRGLALLGVVRRQRGVGPCGAVLRGDLPGQVVYPVPAVSLCRLIVTPPNASGGPLRATWCRSRYQSVTDNAPGVQGSGLWSGGGTLARSRWASHRAAGQGSFTTQGIGTRDTCVGARSVGPSASSKCTRNPSPGPRGHPLCPGLDRCEIAVGLGPARESFNDRCTVHERGGSAGFDGDHSSKE